MRPDDRPIDETMRMTMLAVMRVAMVVLFERMAVPVIFAGTRRSVLVVAVSACWHVDQGDVVAVFVGLGTVVILAGEMLVLVFVLDRTMTVPVSVGQGFWHRENGSGL